jgi:DNA-binding NarL/FixJ family response regulator
VLVADDHPIMVEGLSRLLGEACEVVGVARSGAEVVESARRLRPDLVVSDVTMPGMSGIDAMITLQSEFPGARVIVMTTFDGDGPVQRALKAGASSYILKNMPPREIVEVIRQVDFMSELLGRAGRVRPRDLPEPDASRTMDAWRGHALRHGEFLGLGSVQSGVLQAWRR